MARYVKLTQERGGSGELGELGRLPAEIRNAIYGLVLLSELEIYPHQYQVPGLGHTPGKQPDLSLLHVNKHISAEARPVFYSNVIFNLETGSSFYQFFLASHEAPVPRHELKESRFLVRHLSIGFLPHLLEQEVIPFKIKNLWRSNDQNFRHSTRNQRMTSIHEIHWRNTQMTWTNTIRAIRWLVETGHMRTLKVNLRDAYCPLGCWYVHFSHSPMLVQRS